jgi:hypothetical protein
LVVENIGGAGACAQAGRAAAVRTPASNAIAQRDMTFSLFLLVFAGDIDCAAHSIAASTGRLIHWLKRRGRGVHLAGEFISTIPFGSL